MAYAHILLIDDDQEDGDIFLTAVNNISPSVVVSYLNNAEKALHQLSLGKISPEIIFLDLNMPLMNGKEFLVKIKKDENLSQIPIVIYTTSSDPVTMRQIKELGAHHFITKPSDFNELIDLLKPFIE
jgi:CheY-like chemotaxis protein